jgi:hypothetical protein
MIQYGFEFIQCFGTTSGLIVTSVVNRMKKLQYKLKPPFAEQLKKYGHFHSFPLAKIALVIEFLVKSL